MTDLVVLEKNEPVTTSLIIAEGVKKDHSSMIKLIRKYENDLNEFGTCRFEILKTKGRPLEYVCLNEQQTTLLITFMRNNDVVINFKKNLVKEFYKMKKVLSEISSRQQNDEWKQLRSTGKLTRKKESDTIKKFVEYAENQGSKNARRYYMNISTMENKTLFFIQEKFPNLREVLTGQQLQVMSSADQIVEKALLEGMEKEMFYKDIFLLAKERIIMFSEIIPKTIVPMIENLKLKGGE